MAKLNLNLENVNEEGGSKYSKVPAAIYNVIVESAEVKETKAGGHLVEFALKITEGDHIGKLLVDRVNINVPSSPKATEIGLGRMKKIAICTGAKNPSMIADTDELITGKVFKIETHMVNNEYEGKTIEMTEVKRYLSEEGSTQSTTKADAKPAGSKKPWEK